MPHAPGGPGPAAAWAARRFPPGFSEQDTEPDPDGGVRIAQRVAPDRVIPTVDPAIGSLGTVGYGRCWSKHEWWRCRQPSGPALCTNREMAPHRGLRRRGPGPRSGRGPAGKGPRGAHGAFRPSKIIPSLTMSHGASARQCSDGPAPLRDRARRTTAVASPGQLRTSSVGPAAVMTLMTTGAKKRETIHR